MFDRFIRLSRARQALRQQRWETALALSCDPVIREERRAGEIQAAAIAGLRARARRRIAAGELAAARSDLEQIVANGDDAEARSELGRLQSLLTDARDRQQATRQQIDAARLLAQQGRLAAATDALRELESGLDDAADLQALHRAAMAFVTERQRTALETLATAAVHLAKGALEAARRDYQQAAALDGDAAARWSLRAQLSVALATQAAGAIDGMLRRGDLAGAVQTFRRSLAGLPDPAAAASAADVPAIAARLTAALRAGLRDSDVDAAHELARVIACIEAPPEGGLGALVEAAKSLLAATAARDSGDLSALVARLGAAAEVVDAPWLCKEWSQLRELESACHRGVEIAKARATEGDLGAARDALAGVLALWPLHAEARRELELLDQGCRERATRVEAIRSAAREGRLRHACAMAQGFALPGTIDAEIQPLLRDIRARMEVVRLGLDQVRTALHGRESATVEGVRHLRRRVEELAKVQADHEDVPRLLQALDAEIEGLGLCDQIAGALAAASPPGVERGVAGLLALRAALLSAERLDARLLAIADRVAQAAAGALDGGRLAAVEGWIGALTAMAQLLPDLRGRAEELRLRAAERRSRAEELFGLARQQLAVGELPAVERLLAEAQQHWADAPDAGKLADQLSSLRRQEQMLDRVSAFAAEQDFANAQQQLAELPPTPRLLRTRVYDMKRELARAQGLEGAFVLRVDEGGEYLVLRGDTISIGNVRETRADLPILASIAGRHARIERRMSFHGGMEDVLVAEDGEVQVGGAVVRSHRLRSGETLRLGGSLQMAYRVPSQRSLTAELRLRGGFQVAGTDRILLLKDRGRDGRILIGSGRDGHVQVTGATGEVEIFAHRTGQVRVRCDGAGTIDGHPFQGEHPVDAGAFVEASGIRFVLLPWHARG